MAFDSTQQAISKGEELPPEELLTGTGIEGAERGPGDTSRRGVFLTTLRKARQRAKYGRR